MENSQNFSPNLAPNQPTYDKPKKKRKWLRVILIAMLVIILLPVVLYVGLDIYGRITATKDFGDSEIQIKDMTWIKPEDNGFFLMQEAFLETDSRITNLDQIIEGLSLKENETLKSITAEYRNGLSLFNQVDQKPYFQPPDGASKESVSMPMSCFPNDWRYAASISIIKAIDLFESGEKEASINQVITTLRIGEKVATSQYFMTAHNAGTDIMNQALKVLESIVRQLSIDDPQRLIIKKALIETQNINIGFVNAQKFNYLLSDLSLNKFANDPTSILENNMNSLFFKLAVKNKFFFDKLATKKMYFDLYEKHIAMTLTDNCSDTYVETVEREINEIILLTKENNNNYSRNFLGKLHFSTTANSFSWVFSKGCLCQNRVDLLLSQLQ